MLSSSRGQCRGTRAGFYLRAVVIVGTLLAPRAALASIITAQSAALDQPRIYALLRRTAGGVPLTADFGGQQTFNIEAFLDTGASGLLLSNNTADFLGVQRSHFPEPSGPLVTYEDVGVNGSDVFNVSESLHMSLAPYHPDSDVDNPATYNTVYNQNFGPLRLQVGPAGGNPDPFLEDLDVLGMPAMAGKVVVMDPKPVDTFLDTIRTYIYNPGTPFNPAAADTNPGIPSVNRHVKLSYASFDRFTKVLPAGAPGPTLRNNPFIGPNPVAKLDPSPPPDDTPPVTITLNGVSANGSFLLDTGAAASIISVNEAANVHVRYKGGTQGTDNPQLEVFNPAKPGDPGTPLPDQFQLTIGGIGGTSRIAGFFLDSMLVRTEEAAPGVDGDANNLLFAGAPVLVDDITVKDPVTLQTLTLDGIFGMNYLVASANIIEAEPLPIIFDLTPGPANWLVFDEQAGELGLDVKGVPEPGTMWVLGAVASLVLLKRRGRRPGR